MAARPAAAAVPAAVGRGNAGIAGAGSQAPARRPAPASPPAAAAAEAPRPPRLRSKPRKQPLSLGALTLRLAVAFAALALLLELGRRRGWAGPPPERLAREQERATKASKSLSKDFAKGLKLLRLEQAGSAAVLRAYSDSPEREAFSADWAAMGPEGRALLADRARAAVLKESLILGDKQVAAGEKVQMITALVPELFAGAFIHEEAGRVDALLARVLAEADAGMAAAEAAQGQKAAGNAGAAGEAGGKDGAAEGAAAKVAAAKGDGAEAKEAASKDEKAAAADPSVTPAAPPAAGPHSRDPAAAPGGGEGQNSTNATAQKPPPPSPEVPSQLREMQELLQATLRTRFLKELLGGWWMMRPESKERGKLF